MTRVLLDTHAFLWFVFDDPRLSEAAATLIVDRSSAKLLSVASLWEIAIKRSLGKLDLGMRFDEFVASEVEGRELELIAITSAHLVAVADLPFHHRDPFDRLLIAQASVEGVPIVTGDEHFARYGVSVVW